MMRILARDNTFSPPEDKKPHIPIWRRLPLLFWDTYLTQGHWGFRVRKTSPKVNAVGSLPFEIIDEISTHHETNHETLAQASLVCRSWRDGFQPRCYRTLMLDKIYGQKQSLGFLKLLLRTLSVNPALADSVRNISIAPNFFEDGEHWWSILADIAEKCQHLSALKTRFKSKMHNEPGFRDRILQVITTRPLRKLAFLHSFLTSNEMVERMFESLSPHLVHLTMNLSSVGPSDTPLSVLPPSNLRTLILINPYLSPFTLSLIKACCSNHLRVLILDFLEVNASMDLAKILMNDGVDLEVLSLKWKVGSSGCPHEPFMDQVASHLPRLKTLRLGYAFYSARLFDPDSLPPTLEVLHLMGELNLKSPSAFPHCELIEFIRRKGREGSGVFREFGISQKGDYMDGFNEMKSAGEEHGIIVRSHVSLHVNQWIEPR